MELEFFGAAGEITGSCHIVRANGRQILLDCGMIQGSRRDEERNRDPFPFDPAEIDAVVLSHAHIDHSGRLPLLVARGFSGPIFTQRASTHLCRVLLRDSAYLASRDAERRTRKNARRGLPAVKPLYEAEDVEHVLKLLRGLPYHQTAEILPGMTIRFTDAGHILGSASVQLTLMENGVSKTLVFSGDLGQYDSPILRDPEAVDRADAVIMEHTYGSRLHRDRDLTVQELGEVIAQAEHDAGNILIPAFAVGRSQEILYNFGKHYDEWGMDRWQIFLDSPMAIQASEIYWDFPHLYDEEAQALRSEHAEMPPLPNLHLTRTADESRVINRLKSGAIVLAGSGMCNGGRIVHHLKHNLWRENSHVVFVGYQANGSLGRRLVDGADEVRIHGETVQCAAHIHTIGGLSAHGDQRDLAKWYGSIPNHPPVFLVHGEPKSGAVFGDYLNEQFGTTVSMPEPGEKISLESL